MRLVMRQRLLIWYNLNLSGRMRANFSVNLLIEEDLKAVNREGEHSSKQRSVTNNVESNQN